MSLAAVYECDKRAAAICSRMQIVGFGYDKDRAADFTGKLLALEDAAIDELSSLAGRPVNPNSNAQLEEVFLGIFAAPVYFRTSAGKPSFGKDTMRGYAAVQANPRLSQAALAVLRLRRLKRVRVNYIQNIQYVPDPYFPGGCRVHPSWQNYGAVSGRWACRDPNLMNLPRAENDPISELGGIRSLYLAPADYVLWAFDAKQLEMRIAAYASGDEAMIAACESSDLHAGNAAVVFGDEFDIAAYAELSNAPKKSLSAADQQRLAAMSALRSLAKSAGFAICYLAGDNTVHSRIVAEGKNISLRQVQAMLTRMKRAFRGYYQWQNKQLMQTVKTGYVETPLLGRRRWLGHDPSPMECANFPIQGGAADLVTSKVFEIMAAIQQAALRARLVAQVHDSIVFEVHKSDVQALESLAVGIFATPVVFSSSGRPISASFPVDVKASERWS